MDKNKKFLLNSYRNIVKTDKGYALQKVYEEDENGELKETLESENNPADATFDLDCDTCIHNFNNCCMFRTMLEKLPKGKYIPINWTYKCDAYETVKSLNLIKSEEEMIQFIEKTENFFSCPEDFEFYYGFERKCDESGRILETVREAYSRMGKFEKIPDKYPCVIYFDFTRGNLDWIEV